MEKIDYYNRQWASFAKQVYMNMMDLRPAMVKIMCEHKGRFKQEEIIGMIFSHKLIEQADGLRSQVDATIEVRSIIESLSDPENNTP